jgi:putative ABC transport system ATP-binding protein
VGSSGSGKSTLLSILGALDRPSAGSIEFEGRDLSRMSDAELASVRLGRIGFVFQQFNLIPVLSARDNVEAAMAPTGLGSSTRTARAAELLERVGLGSRESHLPSELSGGEQQRVAIARALANCPDVLLADEPTGNLDSGTGENILELIGDLWSDERLTVVLITHDREIAAAAPRQVALADGRVAPGVAAEGPLALAGSSR